MNNIKQQIIFMFIITMGIFVFNCCEKKKPLGVCRTFRCNFISFGANSQLQQYLW